MLSGKHFTNSTWTRGCGGWKSKKGTFYILRYLKLIRATARNVQVMRWMHGCVAFVTDAYKGDWRGIAAFHVFPSCTVRFGKHWVAFGIRVDVHFPVALPRTQHTSRLYVYSRILPLSKCSNCWHTWGWPYTTKQKAHLKITALCHRNLKFRKTLFTVYKEKKVLRPWYVYLYSTTVHINLQVSKTKQCSSKKTDLCTP